MGEIIRIDNYASNFENINSIMLDTCAVIQITNKNPDAIKFLDKTNMNDVAIVQSIKTAEELMISSQNRNIPKEKRQANQHMGFFIKSSVTECERYINAIKEIPNFMGTVGEINQDIYNKALENTVSYNLRWGDAVIYTIAKEKGIDAILTFDGDFSRVSNEITIFKGIKKKV